MGHGHHHHHHDAGGKPGRNLAITLVLTSSYMVAELFGGLWSGSLALLADAGHMFSDSAALALSLVALWIARRPANAARTYGYARVEILAAMANATALIGIAAFILVEAWERFHQPQAVQGKLAMLIAGGGLLMNLAALAILRGSKEHNLNVRGAWLHVASDALGSVGALASGAAIWLFGWSWADPLASALISLLVIRSAWSLLGETVSVLMEGTPEHVDVDALRLALVDLSAVRSVHDLHVWTLSQRSVCCSAHVVADDGADRQQALTTITELLRERFGIHHITVQLEDADFARDRCPSCN